MSQLKDGLAQGDILVRREMVGLGIPQGIGRMAIGESVSVHDDGNLLQHS
jgi:hypothetical protein